MIASAERFALPSIEAVDRAAAALRSGRLVVFPTETFYGLAALPSDARALALLVRIKGREAGKAIPLVAATRAVVERVAYLDEPLAGLAARFWPGPLTLALAPRQAPPAELLSARGSIGVRVPGDERARDLALAAGGLVTSTSANWGGRPPCASAAELEPALLAEVALVLDGGRCPGGAPSTVVGVVQGRVVVFRQGALGLALLAEALGYTPEPCPS